MIYKSPNTGEHVSAHQYIAELIVKRKADYFKEALPYKYWNNKENKWSKEFKTQVSASARLVKKYSPSAIINALNKLSWCYSLMNKQLTEEIKNQQKALDKINSVPIKEIQITEDAEVRKTFKKNKLDKFR